jgi:hypothetical protein
MFAGCPIQQVLIHQQAHQSSIQDWSPLKREMTRER